MTSRPLPRRIAAEKIQRGNMSFGKSIAMWTSAPGMTIVGDIAPSYKKGFSSLGSE
jgi:hypothetical protein